QIAAFPQACLRSDRRAALRQHGLPLREALALEFAEGLPSLQAEGVAGAARFAGGAGRHGRFEG
ncbi:MAG TPA: enoyl-CoA hydratase, partial [Planctomycetes bacterium]|nr:enoyl-CoA hydratase [Planctomycetota bacterium]